MNGELQRISGTSPLFILLIDLNGDEILLDFNRVTFCKRNSKYETFIYVEENIVCKVIETPKEIQGRIRRELCI